MKKTVVGILAHVDSGKTTLAEAMLLASGKIRSAGRVDHGDTALDCDAVERERGITIFASQAVFNAGQTQITLLDTPGHVDFSAETERVLRVLDYAVLVISGVDGVQVHTRTLWRLLAHYDVPTFVFVSKMDISTRSEEELTQELSKELGGSFVDFCAEDRDDLLAETDEETLEEYLESGKITDERVAELIKERKVFPCFFGSGLKNGGVDTLLDALDRYTIRQETAKELAATVYKISRDEKGNRLTHLKVTGGVLKVKDVVRYDGTEEKINQIRIYTGAKYETVDEIDYGICAVTGPEHTYSSQTIGKIAPSEKPVLEPVIAYRATPSQGVDDSRLLAALRVLEEEDPLLSVSWEPSVKEIRISLMGEIQTQVLCRRLHDRFGIDAVIDSGRVLYKETIEDTVEGVGHFEPLRHYAEVHLILEPLARGSGMVFETKCSEDVLDRNWQRLILTHLNEKKHIGVLTGSPITDMKITLASGRSHLKHTEGGDFRESTYRAVRNGLMQAKSILLEPMYRFTLTVPDEQIGRAMNDIRKRKGECDLSAGQNGMSVLTGRVPVSTMNGYSLEVTAYTGGKGSILLENDGYDRCHDEQQVIEQFAYDAVSDTENTPDSVFCSHGSGFNVRRDEVRDYMHLESCLKKFVGGDE